MQTKENASPAEKTVFFRYEREMLPIVRALMPCLLRARESADAQVVYASPVRGVIPDVLIGLSMESSFPAKIQLNNVELHILSKAHEYGTVTREILQDDLYLSSSGLYKALNKLVKAGFLKEHPPGRLAVNDNSVLNSPHIIALELKLYRWRNALNQAKEYLRFANRSYVVLDGSRVRLTGECLAAYEDTGVGLVILDGSQARLVLDAKNNTCNTHERLVAIYKLRAGQKMRLPSPHTPA